MKPKKVPKTSKKNSKVPTQAFELKNDVNYFTLTPVFKFSNVDQNKWKLEEWQSRELKDLIDTFKKMEQLSWNDIFKHRGLNVKAIEDVNYPKEISPDETIYEIRVCKVKRVFGFIDKNIFNLIWFDREHSVCPEGKNRKYG